MAWLDALLGRIFSQSVEIELSSGLNFKDRLAAALNPATKLVDVDIREASVTPDQVAAGSNSYAIGVVLTKALTAGTPGTADDVTVFSSAPWAGEIRDAWVHVSTAIGGSTLTLRSATGGSASALSSALSSASTGTVRNNDTASRAFAKGSAVVVRRSDRGVAGDVSILVVRT
jgi:hypothetical protein